jgi:hypothetical protein
MEVASLRGSQRMLLLVILMHILVLPHANAQHVATSFEQLQALVKPGDTIQVTRNTGRRTTGKLELLTASSLELQVRSASIPQPRFSEADVREIRLERHDSLLNGTLIGFAAGATPGIIFIVGRSKGSDPIQNASTAASIILVPGAIGAGIGALVDALIFKRTTVYRASDVQGSRTAAERILRDRGTPELSRKSLLWRPH